MMRKLFALILCLGFCSAVLAADKPKTDTKEKKEEPKTKWDAGTFTGLEFRSIGPALVSGRVADIAVHPKNNAIRYVAVASGGVWKTTNSGTTWTPVFDSAGSFSIGCVTIDPSDPFTVWVGSGENNSQRSVAYGDGVYKSLDAGKTWENVGLKNSEHIGRIVVDPRNSKIVFVAAQGPLWAPGGDRGVYKTTDGGKTWIQVLKISENTGANDVLMDPRNSDVLYASAQQRRRHVWTQINGGPESALYKSTDGGANWKKLEAGLPKEDMGRIGLAISPVNPDFVFAIIEAANKGGGFYRSTDAGGSWDKRGDYVSPGPQYYNEIIPDPQNVDRIYAMDTFMQVSEDGGKSFHGVGEKYKHVDNHALWIDPNDTNHMLAGCDGGFYETWDRAATWFFNANLPVTQFYRVALDNSTPFYNVYGGTQDNNTLGGPSQTNSASGIANSDWFVTVGGDGFWSQVDPEEPNILYSESQYGGVVRHDRKTGENVDIQPQPGKGEPQLRWNWDSPLIISPHSHTRLYFAAQRLFRSDDRGDNWQPVSPDLSRQIDRNKLKVMGRVWSVDAVAKNSSTSLYGSIVSLAESPVKEGLLYVGTDDGLVQISEDGGANWSKCDKFPGVPENTYVSHIRPSVKDADTVFAAFDNHQMGDFKPYLLKSTDRGKTWSSISGNLPDRGTVYSVAQDYESSDLLFAGTEFGIFFTVDGGKKWLQLKGGMPPIAVKDIAIQKRENDLVLATFGRGFYILDDYTPLRHVSEAMLNQDTAAFSVKKAWMFIPTLPLSLKEKAFLGDAYYTAPNPPFGAVFTYYLKDELKSKKKIRQDKEKELTKDNKDVSYPSWDELQAEDREEAPAVLITVTDEEGHVVRRLTGPVTAGFHRIAWDLRLPPPDPTSLVPFDTTNPFNPPPFGPLAAPGSYRVNIAKRVDGVVSPIGETQSFQTAPLLASTLPAPDYKSVLEFGKKLSHLQRAVLGANNANAEAQKRLEHLVKSLEDTPGADMKLRDTARDLMTQLKDIDKAMNGNPVVRKFQEPDPPSISERVQTAVYGDWTITSAPTGTHRRNYEIAADEFAPVLERLRKVIEVDLKSLEDQMEAAGAPWTPGRVPRWTKE